MDFRKVTLLGLLLVFGASTIGSAAEFYSKVTLTEDGRSVAAIAFSPDGTRIALALDDTSLRLKDISGGEGRLLKWEGQPALSVRFSPDGGRLAMATMDYALGVWDAASGNRIARFARAGEQLYPAAFSPDGKSIVFGSNDGKVRVHDVATSREIAVLEGHEPGVSDAAYSPDGTMIATASFDRTVRLWDAANGHEKAVFRHDQKVNSVAFSADGKRLVTGANGGSAHIFDVGAGRETLLLKAEMDDVLAASFSPDGARIVTGSGDSKVRIWDAATGETIAELDGHGAPVYSVAYSPDGNRIFSAGRDATGRIWTKLPSADMPDGLVGLWYQNIVPPDTPADKARDFVRMMCLANPINIHEDGLIVTFYGATEREVPEAHSHLRCAADLSCQAFLGPPAQGVEPFETTKLTFSGPGSELCLSGECRVLERCPAIAWTDEEKTSGFAEAWEKTVLGRAE